MDEHAGNSYVKYNRHSKIKKDKLRDVIKKERKNSSRLNSIERDYLENVGSENEQLLCLGEDELLENLNNLNFLISDSEDIKDEEEVLKLINDKKKFNFKKVDLDFLDASFDTDYYPVGNFSQLNRDIKLFLKDSEDEVFETAPAPSIIRKFIHLLGNLYRIKTFSVGKGADKRTVLQKTENSGLVFNTRKLDKIIEQGNKAIKWHLVEDGINTKRKNCHKNVKGLDNYNISAKPVDGSIVGEKSVPINDDNVGNQMLQKMGWTPGTGLGRESTGITIHIPAVVKTKRSGII